ncbi:hypothetical protein Z043_109340 [Scleropages formosus]|uniref:Protein MGARP N-terminal domain-containing protein n=1 Tax=Scleropages formosus TaxID=113540 RepID=A0A0P7UQ59_SCLFO|nr:hypothetical protein Z043_109340 [Scleropages formosus]
MFLWRSAWQSLAPLARSTVLPLSRNVVPLRYMSSSVPGSSGGNFVYFAIFGVSLSAGAVYVYRTLSSDKARFKERITEMGNRPKEEWKPKPWPPKESEAEEASETSEQAAEEEAPMAEAVKAVEPVEEAVVEAEAKTEPVVEPEAAVEAALAEAVEETSTETPPATEEANGMDSTSEEVPVGSAALDTESSEA